MKNEEMAEKIFDAFCVDETRTLNHVECIEAMLEFGAWVAKNLHKPLVGGSLPLVELHKWCEEEGPKISAELTLRTDVIDTIVIDCGSRISVEKFGEIAKGNY